MEEKAKLVCKAHVWRPSSEVPKQGATELWNEEEHLQKRVAVRVLRAVLQACVHRRVVRAKVEAKAVLWSHAATEMPRRPLHGDVHPTLVKSRAPKGLVVAVCGEPVTATIRPAPVLPVARVNLGVGLRRSLAAEEHVVALTRSLA